MVKLYIFDSPDCSGEVNNPACGSSKLWLLLACYSDAFSLVEQISEGGSLAIPQA